jgi:hypothetical protein
MHPNEIQIPDECRADPYMDRGVARPDSLGSITQIYLGRAGARRLSKLMGSAVHRVVRLARDREITVVAERFR